MMAARLTAGLTIHQGRLSVDQLAANKSGELGRVCVSCWISLEEEPRHGDLLSICPFKCVCVSVCADRINPFHDRDLSLHSPSQWEEPTDLEVIPLVHLDRRAKERAARRRTDTDGFVGRGYRTC